MPKKLRCLNKIAICDDDPSYLGTIVDVRCDLERNHEGKHVADRDQDNYHIQMIWYDIDYEKTRE